MTEMSEHINELAAALAKAQAAIAPALKDSVNPHFRSKYADLSSVWGACRAALADNGLSVAQMPVNHAEGYAALRTVLMHSSGQYIASTVSARLVKDDPQGLGSALTYLRRYALAAMVGVVADDDDDGNAASSRPQPERKREAQADPPRAKVDDFIAVGPDGTVTGIVEQAKYFQSNGKNVLKIVLNKQTYMLYKDAATYAEMQPGDEVSLRPGKPMRDGGFFVDELTYWSELDGAVTTEEEIPF